MGNRLFLDLAASLPVSEAAVEAMREAAREGMGSPTAPHREGRAARAMLDQARETMRELLGMSRAEQVIFTSGGTEAVHLALGGTLARKGKGEGRVVVTAVEHPSVLAAGRSYAGEDGVREVPCQPDGRVEWESVVGAVTEATVLVAFQAANVDSGVIHRHGSMGKECRRRGVVWLCDVQGLFGHEAVAWEAWEADFLVGTAHRFGGPKGCGFLAVREPERLVPLLGGGRQEFGLRAGVENLPGIVGMAVAAREACEQAEARAAELREGQAQWLAALRSAIPGTRLLGPEPGPSRIPGHLAVRFEGVDAESLALMLDLRGVAIGVGSGCLSRHEKVSGVFRAMGMSDREALGAVLIGVPRGWSREVLERTVAELARAVERVRGDQGVRNR
ncbi:MAG: aminotransferase class V-fold PLP-dependent enzyme [Verrucomicrobiia bacterium]